ncbi:hypothetical protein AC249_AIPGENE12412 [Exaiptasia diaphana]|nr:hypothetical protein AC249_AIPGENE12412 [Exaiptasia diaphana]
MDCVKIHCVCLLVLNFIRVRIEASTLRSDSPLTSETLERLFKKQRYDPRIRPNVNESISYEWETDGTVMYCNRNRTVTKF